MAAGMHWPGDRLEQTWDSHPPPVHDPAVPTRPATRAAFCGYVQEAAGSQSPAAQLAKLADVRDPGVITAAEFDRERGSFVVRTLAVTGLPSAVIVMGT